MTIAVILLILGCVVIYYGAEFVVNGASTIARNLGITPLVVGLTVVALGTSLPEAFVSVTAALKDTASICVSNVVGSNIINIALVLGISCFLFPLKIDKKLLRVEVPFLIIITILLFFFCSDNVIHRYEGGIFLVLFLGFNYYVVKSARNREESETAVTGSKGFGINGMKILFGFIMLSYGASLLIDNAIVIANFFSVPKWIIGITIVAFGTSLPEMATSIVASVRKEGSISVGTVIGSNIFNILFVIGLSSVLTPLHLDLSSDTKTDFLFMLFFTLALFPLMRTKYLLEKLEGLILLAGYVVFIVWMFIR